MKCESWLRPKKSLITAFSSFSRLSRMYFRVGGAGVGRASVSLKINSHDTIVDHTWVWRADHGSGVGWNSNTGANGVVVNGNNVTVYGLFVEHYQDLREQPIRPALNAPERVQKLLDQVTSKGEVNG